MKTHRRKGSRAESTTFWDRINRETVERDLAELETAVARISAELPLLYAEDNELWQGAYDGSRTKVPLDWSGIEATIGRPLSDDGRARIREDIAVFYQLAATDYGAGYAVAGRGWKMPRLNRRTVNRREQQLEQLADAVVCCQEGLKTLILAAAGADPAVRIHASSYFDFQELKKQWKHFASVFGWLRQWSGYLSETQGAAGRPGRIGYLAFGAFVKRLFAVYRSEGGKQRFTFHGDADDPLKAYTGEAVEFVLAIVKAVQSLLPGDALPPPESLQNSIGQFIRASGRKPSRNHPQTGP